MNCQARTTTLLIVLIKGTFNGLQWVGWMWSVLISQQIVSLLELSALRDVLTIFSIIINESLWTQVFGRIIIYLERRWTNPNIQSSMYSPAIYKNMISCVASGVTFDFIDRSISAVFAQQPYLFLLFIRCFSVFTADRLVFHVVIELLDVIENRNWMFTNAISNIEGASTAGISAIMYTLASELGAFICSEYLKEENAWLVGLFCSPFICIGTGIALPVAILETKLWSLLDHLNMFSRYHALKKKPTMQTEIVMEE